MRTFATVLAVAAISGQLATPALANDIFNSTTALGWRRTNDTAAMAYFRMPLASAALSDTRATAPRIGLMLSAPQMYSPGLAHIHLDTPRIADLSFSPHGSSMADSSAQRSLIEQSGWIASLNLGNSVAWSSDKRLAPGEAPHLFESGLSWVAVGILSAGAIAGVVLLIDRK